MARNLEATAIPDDWKYDLLDKFAVRCSGHTPSKSNPEYWNGGIKWISLTDSYKLDKGYIYETDKEISIAGISNSSAEVHPAETVVLSRDAGIGKSGVMAEAMAVSQHFIAWKCDNKEKLNSWFLYNWLQFNKAEFERQAVGSTIKTIGLPYFKKLKIAIPPYPEQHKIAQILSTWDKAIATTEQLLANSQLLRKALMQQLLTGNRRFKGYDAKWISIKIGDILKEVKRPVNWSDDVDYKLLSVKRRSEGVVLREVLNGGKILTKKMNIARKDDFLISKMQILHGAAGLVPECFDGFHVSDSYISLVSKDPEKLGIEFFSWYSQQKKMYHKAYLCSYGVHIEKMTFNFNMYLKEYVHIPSNVNEQKSIVEALNTASREIENIEFQLKNLKQEKKALMQQLLTGKRRVKVDAA